MRNGEEITAPDTGKRLQSTIIVEIFYQGSKNLNTRTGMLSYP